MSRDMRLLWLPALVSLITSMVGPPAAADPDPEVRFDLGHGLFNRGEVEFYGSIGVPDGWRFDSGFASLQAGADPLTGVSFRSNFFSNAAALRADVIYTEHVSVTIVQEDENGEVSRRFTATADDALSTHPAAADFTGDGRSDVALWRPGDNFWYVNRDPRNPSNFFGFPFGLQGDVLVPRDFDGDLTTDAAIFRPSTRQWWLHRSRDGDVVWTFGLPADIPVPADYDGDGSADIAVFRPTTGDWWIQPINGDPAHAVHWGQLGDLPVPGDYDGDSHIDLAVWRPGNHAWYILPASGAPWYFVVWGTDGDRLVPGDYDGDGRTDAAVWRSSDATWRVLPGNGGPPIIAQVGQPGDLAAPGDYDGNGTTDFAVVHPGTPDRWRLFTGGGSLTVDFGQTGDIPLALTYTAQG